MVMNLARRYPILLFIALTLGALGGYVLHNTDLQRVHFRRAILAGVLAILGTSAMSIAWAVGNLPFDLPIHNWYLFLVSMGAYEASALFIVNVAIPWAPFRIRAITTLAILSGAIVMGLLSYGEGDRMLLPTLAEEATNYSGSALFAMVAVLLGHLVKRGAMSFRSQAAG